MAKDPAEWLRQAEYDMETADAMFAAGRYMYAVFMCHLSIEKALKGIYHLKLNELPPRTHNLIYLVNEITVKPPEAIGRFLIKLNEASVTARYPDELQEVLRDYTGEAVAEMIIKSKEVLQWIKTLR